MPGPAGLACPNGIESRTTFWSCRTSHFGLRGRSVWRPSGWRRLVMLMYLVGHFVTCTVGLPWVKAALVDGRRVMVADWLVPMVSAGSAALVGAVATDAWQSVRSGVLQLFRQGGQRKAELAERWVDETASAITAAPIPDQLGCANCGPKLGGGD